MSSGGAGTAERMEGMEDKAALMAAPELVEAEEELGKLISKSDLLEIKSLAKPPHGMMLTMNVVCVLLGRPPSWKESKRLLSDATLLDQLLALHRSLPKSALDAVSPYLSRHEFVPAVMAQVSVACASLCKWARALCKYHTLAYATAQAAWAEAAQKPKEDLLEKAVAALRAMSVRDLQELKSLGKPPSEVDHVCICLMHLLTGIHPAVEVTRKGNVKNASWRGAQIMMADPQGLLQVLVSFKDLIDTGRVPRRNIERARSLVDELGDEFSPHVMARKSGAASQICAWVRNIITYHDIAAPTGPSASADARPLHAEPVSNKSQNAPGLEGITIRKSSVAELKRVRAPPEGVIAVCRACCLLLLGEGQEIDWKSSQKMVAKAGFLEELLALDPHKVSEGTLDEVEAILGQSFPNPEAILKQSVAAADLARWVISVVQCRRTAGRGGT